MKNSTLSPLKPKKYPQRIKIAFADTEAMGTKSAHFRCGSVCWIERKRRHFTTFFSLEEFFNFLTQFDVTYFYNLKYDSQYLRNFAFESGKWKEFEISSGSNILGLIFSREFTDSQFIVKDILPFCQTTLEKACSEYGCVETKFDVDFDNCTNDEIKQHCEQDVKMLHELAEKIRQIAWEETGVDPFHRKIYSPPSYFMKVLRTNFVSEEIENPFILMKFKNGEAPEFVVREREERFCRDAYKGGYCNCESTELFRNVEGFDVVSQYPFAMRRCRFPVGRAFWCGSKDFFLSHTKKIPGICRVKLNWNNSLICGVRESKLVRLSGLFEETITSYELHYALNNGAKLVEFIEGICFDNYDKHNTISRYISFQFKRKAQTKGGKRLFNKLGLNCIYGKFAQNYIQEKNEIVYCHNSEEEFDAVESFSPKISRIIKFESGSIVIGKRESFSPKAFMNVVWGALITALSRLYLLEQADNCNSIYEDTDSVKCTIENISKLTNMKPKNISPEQSLGYWEGEGKFVKFRALAPKFYAGLSRAGEFGKPNFQKSKLVKAKGVPLKQRQKFFWGILEGKEEFQTEEYIKLMSPREGLLAKTYLDKEGIFGGVRVTSKCLIPKPKPRFFREYC